MKSATDNRLLALAKDGDEGAFGVLFDRYRADALTLARRVAGDRDAEDIAAEAFERIFAILRDGRGPKETFRPYLGATIHNLAANRIRRRSREVPTEPMNLVPLLVSDDSTGRHLRNDVLRDAVADLPARWQQVLWLCEIEQLPHSEVGELLGLNANAVAALALRARRGLADAYLAQYARAAAPGDCQRVASRLPAYVNGHLAPPAREAIDRHVTDCAACRIAVGELQEARRDIGALLAPLIALVTAASEKTAAGVGATTTAAGSLTKALLGAACAAGVAGTVAASMLVAAPGPSSQEPSSARTPVQVMASIPSAAPPMPLRTRPPESSSPPEARATSRPSSETAPSGHRSKPPEDPRGSAASAPPDERGVTSAAPSSSTAQPGPTSSPPTAAPASPASTSVSDPRLGTPSWGPSPKGRGWHRVTVEAIADGPTATVELRGYGAALYCWGLTQGADAEAQAPLPCKGRDDRRSWADVVRVGTSPAWITVDLKLARSGYLTLTIAGTDDHDQDPGNNRRSVRMPRALGGKNFPLNGP